MGRHSNFNVIGTLQSKGEFCWTVTPTDEGGELEFISGPREDIDSAIRDVQEAVDALGQTLDPLERAGTDDVDAAVTAIEREGRKLAQAMFGADLSSFEELMAGGGIEYISLSGPRFLAPWPIEFCVLDIAGRPTYLGELCIIVRRFPLKKSHRGEFHALDPIEAPWRTSYAEDDTLESSADEHGKPGGDEHELRALAPMVDGRYDQIDFLKSLDPRMEARHQADFQSWIANSRDVVHFNSHTVVDEAGRYLQVTRSARIGRGDFVKDTALAFTYDAFVFLNACSSAFGRTLWDGSVAVAMAEAGAGAVACTTGQIDGKVATAFATEFYRQFASPGTTAVQALLRARRRTNESTGNPLSNLYTLLGTGDFQLRRPKEE